MTVNSDIGFQRTSGDGVVTVFGVDFAIIEAAQLIVELVHKTTGVVTTQILDTHYTLAIAADRQSASVTMLTPPPATHWVNRRRAAIYTQPTHLLPHGPFPADLVELAIDRLAMGLQAIRDGFQRGIRFNDTDPPNPLTLPPLAQMLNRYVYIDGSGNAVGVEGEATAPVSSPWAPVIASASLAAGLGLLGFSSYMQALGATASKAALLTALGIDGVPFPIDNASCQVKQQSGTTNLSTSPQHAKVDRFAAWASGGAVSAGTIGQNTAATIGRAGYSLQLAGVTLTGAGKLAVRHRMEALQARQLRNRTVSFGVAVLHNCTGAINYTVNLRKPTAADDFTATALIASSSAQSIASGVASRVLFQSQALGDVSNGLEIEIVADCGAVTTKNFEFTEFTLAADCAVTPAFNPLRGFSDELVACQRFWEAGNWSFNEAYVSGSNQLSTQIPFKATKRVAAPTCNLSTGTLGSVYADSFIGIIAVASTNFHQPFTWTADARFAP